MAKNIESISHRELAQNNQNPTEIPLESLLETDSLDQKTRNRLEKLKQVLSIYDTELREVEEGANR